jgi:hypothetical protein
MGKAIEQQDKSMHLSIHLSETEAEGLAHLCKIMDWDFLHLHTEGNVEVMKARYAFARLRFALSDAGYEAMP